MASLDDVGGKLTEYDYEFLKGNEVFWPTWGAALGVTLEFCRNSGYGNFGKPTEKGRKAMEEYEAAQDKLEVHTTPRL